MVMDVRSDDAMSVPLVSAVDNTSSCVRLWVGMRVGTGASGDGLVCELGEMTLEVAGSSVGDEGIGIISGPAV